MTAISTLVKKLKESDSDFEFYPTTDEQIDAVLKAIDENEYIKHEQLNPAGFKFLDVGAGNGKVLMAIQNYAFKCHSKYSSEPRRDKFYGELYAIEKSQLLIQEMSNDIFVIGTDLFSSTLVDKECSIIFSNPPYGCFSEWTLKILNEAASKLIYLILPQRWKNNDEINKAIKNRGCSAKVLGSYDYLNAERAARAKVDIIEISPLRKIYKFGSQEHVSFSNNFDPMGKWFDENISVGDKVKVDSEKPLTFKDKLQNALVEGSNICQTLVRLYDAEMDHLYTTYKTLGAVDPDLLEELDIDRESVFKSLTMRISGLKRKYWKELFEHYEPITEKLTCKTREAILDSLNSHSQVDFTVDNVIAITTWTIKKANEYYDSQILNLFDELVTEKSAQAYVSNHKTLNEDKWRYTKDTTDKYKLDYRIINYYGENCVFDTYSGYGNRNEMKRGCIRFLNDILVVASQLGFDTSTKHTIKTENMYWCPRQENEYYYFNHTKGDSEILMSVRAHANGTLHFKFNKRFIQNLNIEYGRLRGWLRSAKEASNELGISLIEAEETFGNSFQLTPKNSLLQLGFIDKHKQEKENINSDNVIDFNSVAKPHKITNELEFTFGDVEF